MTKKKERNQHEHKINILFFKNDGLESEQMKEKKRKKGKSKVGFNKII